MKFIQSPACRGNSYLPHQIHQVMVKCNRRCIYSISAPDAMKLKFEVSDGACRWHSHTCFQAKHAGWLPVLKRLPSIPEPVLFSLSWWSFAWYIFIKDTETEYNDFPFHFLFRNSCAALRSNFAASFVFIWLISKKKKYVQLLLRNALWKGRLATVVPVLAGQRALVTTQKGMTGIEWG